MAERDFVKRLEKSGFTRIEILQRRPWGIEDCERYPLFDADLLALMRNVIPEAHHDRVAESIVIRARLGR